MNNHDYHAGPEICTNCGGHDFEDVACLNCGKWTTESQEAYEDRLLYEEIESRR